MRDEVAAAFSVAWEMGRCTGVHRLGVAPPGEHVERYRIKVVPTGVLAYSLGHERIDRVPVSLGTSPSVTRALPNLRV